MRRYSFMKIPVLIFLISGIATRELEPVAARGLDAAMRYAHSHNNVKALSSQLADVQLDMMQVLRTEHDSPVALQTQEAGLKYALRAEQIRLAEQSQCRQSAQNCPSEKPRS
jgi:hypothetical protein